MLVLAKPGLLVRRRLDALCREYPRALAGEIEGVHQTRVACRRLREVLPLMGDILRGRETKALRRDVAVIGRALGPLREADVAIETLAGLVTSAPEYAPAGTLVTAHLAVQRARAWRQARRGLRDVGVGPLVKDLVATASSLSDSAPRARWAACSSTRLLSRIARLDDAMALVVAVYAPGPLHEVRIALKKLRYALEFSAELGRLRLARSLRRLKEIQDVLGTMHDLQVLASCVRDCEAATRSSSGRQKLLALTDVFDERARQCHSQYLARRAVLPALILCARRAAANLASMGD
jgi:CHAD domain-containing protein